MAAKSTKAPRGGKRVKIGRGTYLCRAVRVRAGRSTKKVTRAFCRRPKKVAHRKGKK